MAIARSLKLTRFKLDYRRDMYRPLRLRLTNWQSTWPWFAAAICGFIAGWLWLIALPRLSLEQKQLTDDIARFEAQIRGLQAQQKPAMPAQPAQNIFPAEGTVNEFVARVSALSRAQEVNPNSIVVRRPESEKKKLLQRVEVSTRLSGQYPQIKAVIAALLAEYPAVAMDSVSMMRNQAAIDAEIYWSLYIADDQSVKK
jgi:Type II secretion system (T2SS), protein M subtype b